MSTDKTAPYAGYRPAEDIARDLAQARSETLIGAPNFRQKPSGLQMGWRRGNGKWVWFDVPKVAEDAPDVE